MRFIRPDENISCDSLSVLNHLDSLKDPVQLTNGILNTKAHKREKKYSHLRLSEIDNACPREWTLGNLTQATRSDVIAFAGICAMDLGSALHNWVQNRDAYFERSLGYWLCQSCLNRRRFGVRPTENCEFCGANARATIYDEYMFRLDFPFRVVGKVDLIIRVGDVYRFVEIKTTGKDVTGPIGQHVVQLASYMYFSQFDDIEPLPIKIDRSVGYLVYFNKMFNYRAPIKTFPVVPTDRFMAPVIDVARQFTRGVNDGILPDPWQTCKSSDFSNGTAKKCPVSDLCKSYYLSGKIKITV